MATALTLNYKEAAERHCVQTNCVQMTQVREQREREGNSRLPNAQRAFMLRPARSPPSTLPFHGPHSKNAGRSPSGTPGAKRVRNSSQAEDAYSNMPTSSLKVHPAAQLEPPGANAPR